MPKLENELDCYQFLCQFLVDNRKEIGSLLGINIEEIEVQLDKEKMREAYEQFYGNREISE